MKQTITILVFLFISAQLFAKGNHSWGLTMGTNYATIENRSYGQNPPKGQFYQYQLFYPSIGFYYKGEFIDWLGYQTSLMYNPIGGSYNLLSIYGLPKQTNRLNCLYLPLEIVMFPRKKINLKLGTDIWQIIGKTGYEEVPSTKITKTGLGYRYGIQFPISIIKVNVSYCNSFTSWNESIMDSQNGTRYYNKYFQLSLSVPVGSFFKNKQ